MQMDDTQESNRKSWIFSNQRSLSQNQLDPQNALRQSYSNTGKILPNKMSFKKQQFQKQPPNTNIEERASLMPITSAKGSGLLKSYSSNQDLRSVFGNR